MVLILSEWPSKCAQTLSVSLNEIYSEYDSPFRLSTSLTSIVDDCCLAVFLTFEYVWWPFIIHLVCFLISALTCLTMAPFACPSWLLAPWMVWMCWTFKLLWELLNEVLHSVVAFKFTTTGSGAQTQRKERVPAAASSLLRISAGGPSGCRPEGCAAPVKSKMFLHHLKAQFSGIFKTLIFSTTSDHVPLKLQSWLVPQLGVC